jgi:hypothetical protein
LPAGWYQQLEFADRTVEATARADSRSNKKQLLNMSFYGFLFAQIAANSRQRILCPPLS